jgi:LmbE family N-acetylglucosaminyl deacetylase
MAFDLDVRVPDHPLRVLVIGAHMDDCEIRFGGTAAMYRERGHHVTFVSMTNGCSGHHELGGRPLVERRTKEFQASADEIGAKTTVFDADDGALRPTIERREELIRTIRRRRPDLIVTHRPNDYHPDHRYTEQLVRDAAYMVTVPHVCPTVEHLEYNPVVGYVQDEFEKPSPFDPDVVVPIDDVVETKIDMLHHHESQMYEWLPYNAGMLDEVPDDEDERRDWLREQWLPDFADVADRYREQLVEQYGTEGEDVEYAEAFECGEHGGDLAGENRDALFPFIG